MADFDWRAFLQGFSRELLSDPQVARSLAPEVVASGWLGFDGATEDQIRAVEARLGHDLPPSYRTFLAITNGWRNVGATIHRMWSTAEVEWFRVRNQQWIDAYVEPLEGEERRPDGEYLVYGEEQDSVLDRPEYLQTALEISDTGDSAILLLNPLVLTPDGEWEPWLFANWLPGATRYPSFRELMETERLRFVSLRTQDDRPRAKPPSFLKTLWREMRVAWQYGRSTKRQPRGQGSDPPEAG